MDNVQKLVSVKGDVDNEWSSASRHRIPFITWWLRAGTISRIHVVQRRKGTVEQIEKLYVLTDE
jgi:hypothetical protein